MSMGGTLFAALAAYSGCAAARWYLDRSSRRDTDRFGGRVRLKSMWNEGAAFSLPMPPEVLPPASAAALALLWVRRRSCPLGTGLILGGGLSNFYERARRGRTAGPGGA